MAGTPGDPDKLWKLNCNFYGRSFGLSRQPPIRVTGSNTKQKDGGHNGQWQGKAQGLAMTELVRRLELLSKLSSVQYCTSVDLL